MLRLVHVIVPPMQVEFHIEEEAGAHDTIKSGNVNTGSTMFARLYAK